MCTSLKAHQGDEVLVSLIGFEAVSGPRVLLGNTFDLDRDGGITGVSDHNPM